MPYQGDQRRMARQIFGVASVCFPLVVHLLLRRGRFRLRCEKKHEEQVLEEAVPRPARFKARPVTNLVTDQDRIGFGLLLSPPYLMHKVQRAVASKDWKDLRYKIYKHHASSKEGKTSLALAVSRKAAQHLDAQTAEIPVELATLLLKGSVVWRPDLDPPAAPAPPPDRRGVILGQGAETVVSTVPASFTFIELFAGIGGFNLGLTAAGGRCEWACEIDKFARDTYAANFGHAPAGVDVTTVRSADVPDHDILTAGFPCQTFSFLGESSGLDSSKGQLFFQIVRIARRSRPKAMLLENVRGLLFNQDGYSFRVISDALAKLGYRVHHKLINSCKLVPQRRERLYMVCFREDLGQQVAGSFRFPDIEDLQPTVMQILGPPPVPVRYDLTERQWAKVQSQPHFKRRPGARLVQLQGQSQTIMSSYRRGFTMYSQFVPQWETGRLPRFLTARECARLQGFPDSFRLHPIEGRAYVQVGNAVTPPIIERLGVAIVGHLQRHKVPLTASAT